MVEVQSIFRPQSCGKLHAALVVTRPCAYAPPTQGTIRNSTRRAVGRGVEDAPLAAEARVQRVWPTMSYRRIPSPDRSPVLAPRDRGRARLAGARGAPLHPRYPAGHLLGPVDKRF